MLKFRFPLSLPNRGDATLVPGVLAGILVAMLGLQLWLAGLEPEQPPVLPINVRSANSIFQIMPQAIAAQAIFSRPLFAPRQTMSTPSGTTAPLALGGASVAGTVTIRGRGVAVVRRTDGSVANVSIGGVVGGWRLIALREEGAVFANGKEQRLIRYSGAASQTADDEAPAE